MAFATTRNYGSSALVAFCMSVMLFVVVLPHRLPYRIQNEPTFILYDAEGKHGECAEGPETYIKECVQ